MPTYDYRCLDCGHTIELIHSMSEDGPSACDVCGGPVRRVLFPAGIIFKGAGFYRNDSRKASPSSGSSQPAPATAVDAPTGGGSTDAAAASSKPPADKGADSGSGAKPAPPPATTTD